MRQNIKPLVIQAKLLNRTIENMIKNYETNWKNVKAEDKGDPAINDMYEQLEILKLAATKTYSTLAIDLEFLFKDKELTEDEEALYKDLRDVSFETTRLSKRMEEMENDYVERFVVQREKSYGIMNPEKVIKGITRWFATTSTIQTTAIQTLFKKANRVLGYAAMDAVEQTRVLQGLKVAYDAWARKSGITNKNYFDYIKKKDKNELIDEYKKEFYSSLRDAIERRDYSWIISNVDVQAYKEILKSRLQEEIERIENRVAITEQDERQKSFDISNAKNLYNIDTPTSPGWLVYDSVKKAPKKDLWETDEWKRLNAVDKDGNYINKPALDFYNYIKERNEYFQSIGYINKSEARVFLPFVRKSVMEKIAMGGKISIGEQFLRTISIDEGDIGYGKRDRLSGELINTVPIYLTQEIEGELSQDLFKTMSLYNELAIKFKYLTDVEYQVRALVNIERKKKSIATSMFGKTVYKEGVLQYDESNDENAKLIEDMMKAIIYQQKYIESESFDQILGKIGDFGRRANEKLGMKIFPEDLSERQITINKVFDQLNNTFQLTALGLNPLSGLSNYLGGSFQSTINAGKYFTRTEFDRNVLWLTASKLTGRGSPKKYLAAMEYFLPLTENYNRELAKKLTLSNVTTENLNDVLMMFMRFGDMTVQAANFFSFLENSVVIDGKIVNAREYLKTQPEYIDMYAGTEQERRDRIVKFEEDVKKLIEDKGVLKDGVSSLEVDGTLKIEGIDRKSDSVIELRRKVQGINKDALGNLSEDDLRLINLNIIGKSFMIFKNWIPRPVDVRMGNLKYNSTSDAYEWGRMRMVFRMLSWRLWESLSNMKNALQANDKGVDYMRKLWEKKRQEYKEDTGKELNMTESQFMDLVRHNIKAQAVDTIFMLTLFAIAAGLKANAVDDDEEDESVKNMYRFIARAADKIRDELLYFYDPTSLISTVSSGVFPSLSYINNFTKLLKNFMIENYAIVIGDEVLEEKTKVIKYLMKSFPVANQAAGMLPMFYPELAKELGIKATTEARPIGF